MPSAIHTKLQQITDQVIVDRDAQPISDGEARLAIRQFALTANNVTYAATGFDIGYWQFFPTGDPDRGIVPVWGFAEVVETRSDAAPLGARFYGFYPMAEELVIRPEATPSRTIRDASPHRAELPLVYNLYVPAAPAPTPQEPYQALLQPLIATSWLIADWLADNGYFGAEQVIVGSASSKTGLGLCAFLRDTPVRCVGLTSQGNTGFVENLGFCDSVVDYDVIDRIEPVPSVYVDMAGNAAVKRALHGHLGDTLKYSAAVGLSHWDRFAPPKDLAGPKPQFFFAPAQIAKRREDWGPGVVEKKIVAATKEIAADAARWLKLVEHQGMEAAMGPYADLAAGKADPSEGHVVSL